MKVRELVELLKMADQESDVKLVAHDYDVELDSHDISFNDSSVCIELSEFVDSVADFDEAVSAL